MDAARREAIYLRLTALQTIDMDHAVERGPTYLLERLKQCRRQQDEVLTLSVEIKRALSVAKVNKRAAKSALAWLGRTTTPDAQRLQQEYNEAEDAFDELRTLEEVAAISRMNLRTADSDIRLGAMLVEQQIKLGEITPPKLPEDTDVSAPADPGEVAASAFMPGDAEPVVTATTVAQPAAAPAVDLSALFAMNAGPVTPDTPAPVPAVPAIEIPVMPTVAPPTPETVTMPAATATVPVKSLSDILSSLS